MFIGRGVLESIFDKMEMREDVKTLLLSFPERWLNIIEQRSLYKRLEAYCPNLKSVMIKTHSVYIIQVTHAMNVGIVHEEEPLPNEKTPIDQPLYTSANHNLIDANRLNIL